MGVNIEFAIGYAIGFCIVGVIVFLKYERKLDRMSPQELDALLERNGINDKESKEALSYRIIKEEIEKGEI